MTQFDGRAASESPAPREASDAVVVAQHVAETARMSDDRDLQNLWLALQRRTWRSIAVLSGSESIDTQWVAELLAKLVWWYRGQPSTVYDLRDLSLRLVDYQLNLMAAESAGGYAIMALRSTFENPTTGTVARAADAVILCVEIGNTKLKAIAQTIAEVGANRVLGTIVLRKRRGKSGTQRGAPSRTVRRG